MILDVVGKFIREQRKAQELSLEELAYVCETDPSHLSKIERGKHNPTLETVRKIASSFNMNLSELIQHALKDDRDIINAFLSELFPFIKEKFSVYDPLLLLDFFGEIALDKFTLLDIERAAFGVELDKVYKVVKTYVDDPELGRYVIYGIKAEKDGECVVIEDICLKKREVEKLANYLNRHQAPIDRFPDFVEDFEACYMTTINPYAFISELEED